MKIRTEPESNYKAVWINGKTLRIPLDHTQDITELNYPEFYDISLGNKCVTGKCNYCYASGNPHGLRYDNIVEKAEQYFGTMNENQRPFQVAIGGESEPLEHPDFWQFCDYLQSIGIVPNYTTNGVLITQKQIDRTKQFCGGVAVTYHPHLTKFFYRAVDLLVENNVKTNIHIIISDKHSVDILEQLYERYNGRVDYFVLLPYMNVGFAAEHPREVDFAPLERFLDGVYSNGNIAFGANFYEWLQDINKYDVGLYPPEILSKYLIMNDEMELCNNSFECVRV